MRSFSSIQDTGIGRLIRATFEKFEAFHKDDNGSTAIEFGVIATPFFGSIGMAIALGFVFLNSVALEDAVREAGRQIRVGKMTAGNTTKDNFRNYVCQFVAMPETECRAKLVIDVDSAPSVPALPNDDPITSGALDKSKEDFDPGNATDYVIVKTYLPVADLTDFFTFLGSSGNHTYVLASTTVFRNEPF